MTDEELAQAVIGMATELWNKGWIAELAHGGIGHNGWRIRKHDGSYVDGRDDMSLEEAVTAMKKADWT